MGNDSSKAAAAQKPKPGELAATVSRYFSRYWEAKEGEHAALERECIETAQDLLQRDADINDKDSQGTTALMWAARIGLADVVRLLIDKDAALDERNDGGQGYTALSYAVSHGNADIALQLIKAGADTRIENNYGGTLTLEGNVSVKIEMMLEYAPALRRQALEEKASAAEQKKARAGHDTAAARQKILKSEAQKFTLKPTPAARRP